MATAIGRPPWCNPSAPTEQEGSLCHPKSVNIIGVRMIITNSTATPVTRFIILSEARGVSDGLCKPYREER
uniref:Uncharacterized protein n=1 Tax=Micrococcus sp. V7 TaxID=404582 RepID=U5NZV4_9MICC|nr:hypothetical protein LMV7_p00330 [Micrococcus sp. V7]